MSTDAATIWVAIGMLAITVLVLRALYLYAPRRWQPRGTVAQALRFAPLAALVAIVVPEVLAPWLATPDAGLHALLDARVLSAAALLLAARLSGNLLVAIGVGAVVLMVAG
jgi:branched-subunit amino acid transport protein